VLNNDVSIFFLEILFITPRFNCGFVEKPEQRNINGLVKEGGAFQEQREK